MAAADKVEDVLAFLADKSTPEETALETMQKVLASRGPELEEEATFSTFAEAAIRGNKVKSFRWLTKGAKFHNEDLFALLRKAIATGSVGIVLSLIENHDAPTELGKESILEDAVRYGRIDILR